MRKWSDENQEDDWYPFDYEEPVKQQKSIFEGIDPVLGGFGAIGWGCLGCVISSVCGFFLAAFTAVIWEDTQDIRPIEFESTEAMGLIFGWSAVIFLAFVAVSAVGFYLLRQRK